jgi:ribosome recycling factor
MLDELLDELLDDADARMASAVRHTQSEFATLRTGRANPAILSRVMVDYYGTRTPLQQLASTTVPDARMLVVHPFDPGVLAQIERGIRLSDLGLNPTNDGKIIRLVFPPLTEERRRDLIRVARNIAEEGRVAIRHIRRATRDDMAELGESEDSIHRAGKQLQQCTDRYVAKTDELLANKERELLEV